MVDNTAFLIAQFFGWAEILRQTLQFLDLGAIDQTRTLGERVDRIAETFLRDDLGRDLRVFRGDQRALGEEMIERTAEGSRCVGYAAFRRRLGLDAYPFLARLRERVEAFGQAPEGAHRRLVLLQNELVDLLDLLDPQHVRFPAARRTRIAD